MKEFDSITCFIKKEERSIFPGLTLFAVAVLGIVSALSIVALGLVILTGFVLVVLCYIAVEELKKRFKEAINEQNKS